MFMLIKINMCRNSLAVQWLELCASSAGGAGSIPGGVTKIPHAVQYSQKKKKKVNMCRATASWGEHGRPQKPW